MTAIADRPAASPLAGYSPLPGAHDEAFGAPGEPRPAYESILAELEAGPAAHIAESVRAESVRRGVAYGAPGGPAVFPIDPVPRLLSAAERTDLAAGVQQRAEALDAFVHDVYGPRRIVAAGDVPERVITESPLYEPLMQGVEFAAGTAIHVAGPDIVRDADRRLLVLEDNLRSPSGLAYALEARLMLSGELSMDRHAPLPVEDSIGLLRDALWRAAPEGCGDPGVVLLSDGPASAGWFEHTALARRLGIPLVLPGDLRVSAGKVRAKAGDSEMPVDVIYRRTDEERLSRPDGALTELGDVLADPVRRGTVAVANAFGTGVADDKLAHAYVESMIRFYLGQEPMLPSVPTLDLALQEPRERALEDIGRMVVKSRGGLGGGEVEMLSAAGRERREELAATIRRRPADLIVQQQVQLSTHPTVAGHLFEPRRVDLRPFAVRAVGGYRMLQASLTRYAPSAESMHVNSSLGGGAKDTWVIE